MIGILVQKRASLREYGVHTNNCLCGSVNATTSRGVGIWTWRIAAFRHRDLQCADEADRRPRSNIQFIHRKCVKRSEPFFVKTWSCRRLQIRIYILDSRRLCFHESNDETRRTLFVERWDMARRDSLHLLARVHEYVTSTRFPMRVNICGRWIRVRDTKSVPWNRRAC